MPFLKVYSNAELKNQNTAEFTEKAAELLAKELGKPIEYIVVKLVCDKNISFGGSVAHKGVLAYLESVGFKDKQAITQRLTQFFDENFAGLDIKNINVVTVGLQASDVAIGGKFLG